MASRFVAMARKLKVFRTPAGFHDAYVAAPSRKAALAAWGADADLFARGVAEEVTDPALMEEPLARPGEVVKRSRGTAAEQLAALPATKRKAARPRAEKAARPERPPRPSRAALDDAEAAAAEAERRHRRERTEIAAKIERLERERAALVAAQEAEAAELEAVREEAEAAYRGAVAAWRD
jgi:hypothetical protein